MVDSDINDYIDVMKNIDIESWNDIPKHAQDGILEAIEQADSGLLVDHAVVRDKYKKDLS
jgi:hypothetical protein